MGVSALCTVDDASCFYMIRLELKTSVYEMNVTVVSTVTGCDVTTAQQHYMGFNKHASSRCEAVSDSRGVPRCTEKISKHSTLAHVCRSFDSSNPPYQYPETCLVTRRHCTICQVNSSRSALYPCQALISICGIAHVPALSLRCRSGSHQLMTSLEVSEIPNLE